MRCDSRSRKLLQFAGCKEQRARLRSSASNHSAPSRCAQGGQWLYGTQTSEEPASAGYREQRAWLRSSATTLLHCGACKADSGSEKPTADGQRDIRLQEAAIGAQPGDASSLVVWSWELDGHGRAGWQRDRIIPRGETSETPILQRGLPDLVVISHRGGVCEEHLQLCGSIACPSCILI